MTQQLIEQYERELKEFEDWIRTKPHLPQNIGEFYNGMFGEMFDLKHNFYIIT